MKYNQDNIFAKIIREEIPCKKVYEDDKVLSFHDIYPVAPIHILVIPKGEYTDFSDFVTHSSQENISHYFKKLREIAEENCGENGYRIVANTGSKSGQTVFHFHMHIISGKTLTNLA